MGQGRRATVVAALIATCSAGAGTGVASAATPPAVRPATASAFHHSVGVATHPTYYDTPYGDWGQVLARTRELGVEHLRGDVRAIADPGSRARLEAALGSSAQAGIRLHLVIPQDCNGAGPIDPCLDVVRRLPAGSVDFLEWPPELDLRGGPNWPAVLQARGRELYAKAKADPALRAIPVVGPTLVQPASFLRLGDQTAYLDAGNIHPYMGARSPNPLHLLAERRKIVPVSGTKPVIATEAGFHVAPSFTNADQPAADEASAAVYTVRTVLEHFASGIPRTYVYELVDGPYGVQSSQSYYGLLRQDFSPRPAYGALKNLLAMVGAGAPPAASLRYAVTGDTRDLRQLLLQQRDGTYLLILWRTASVWDRDGRRTLSVSPKPFVVDAPDAVAVARGNPHAGTAFTPGTVDGGRIAVNVGAHPAVLQLTTGAGGAGGTGSGPSGSRPGSGVAGTTIPSSGRRSSDRSAPRLTKIRVKKLRNGRWAASFRLSESATVRARVDRRRANSRRYRVLRRVAGRPLRRGTRSRTLGTMKPGRHKVLLGARDAAGNERHVLVAFKVKAAKKRRR